MTIGTMNDMRRAISVFGIAAISLALSACSQADGDSGSGGARGGGGGPPPMPVDVATAVQDTAVEEVVATGQIEAIQFIELRPEVEGRITEISFREGSEVRRGAALFKVDDAELSARVAQLEAERDLARQGLERTRALLADDAASAAEFEEAEARSRSAQAQLDLQQVRLDRTVVRAPFSGASGARSVSLGDYVNSSTALVTLQTVNPQRASFEVPERYAGALALGQTVVFEVAARPGREFVGVVDFVDPRVRLPARTIEVKARVENRDRTLQAGMFIEARLATAVRPEAVWVPEEAVVQLEQGTFVWTVAASGQALRRAVQLGVRRPGRVEILSGLLAGEQVVTAGMERLFEGATVMPRQAIDAGVSGTAPPAPVDDPPTP